MTVRAGGSRVRVLSVTLYSTLGFGYPPVFVVQVEPPTEFPDSWPQNLDQDGGAYSNSDRLHFERRYSIHCPTGLTKHQRSWSVLDQEKPTDNAPLQRLVALRLCGR